MRTIQYAPLDELRAAAVNPKRHDLPTMGASIDRFGFLEPVVLDERTGQLLSGHGRVERLTEAQAAGKTPPEGVTAMPDGRWMVPVVRGWASEDDIEAEAALVAVNALSIGGGWNERSLLTLLEAIEHKGYAGTGFDAWTVDDLYARMEEQAPQLPPETAAAAEPAGSDRYARTAVRSIVLDYPTTEFQRIVDLARDARAARHVPSNAALLVALLEEHDG